MKDQESTLTYYQILGLAPNASRLEIKTAFKTLSMKLHPDRGGSDDTFRELKRAYETLHDPARKAVYDQGVRQGFNPMEFKARLQGTVEQASQSICDTLLNSQTFPPQSIKAAAKSFIVTSRGTINQQLQKTERAHKKLSEAIALVIEGKESKVIKAIQAQNEILAQMLVTFRMDLAVLDMLNDENNLLKMMVEQEQGLLGGFTAAQLQDLQGQVPWQR